MSKRSATDLIRQLNPRNVSGAIPQALDLLQNLQRSSGNRSVKSALGAQALLGMLQFVLNNVTKKKSAHQPTPANTELEELRLRQIQQANSNPN